MVYKLDDSSESSSSSSDGSELLRRSFDSSSCVSDDDTDVLNADNRDDENAVENEYDEMKKYAATENKMVNRWRRIVILSILVAGAIVGGITYVALNGAQENDSTDAVSSKLKSPY
jgi:hypothetical protein